MYCKRIEAAQWVWPKWPSYASCSGHTRVHPADPRFTPKPYHAGCQDQGHLERENLDTLETGGPPELRASMTRSSTMSVRVSSGASPAASRHHRAGLLLLAFFHSARLAGLDIRRPSDLQREISSRVRRWSASGYATSPSSPAQLLQDRKFGRVIGGMRGCCTIAR